MDFQLSDEQTLLRDTTRDLLSRTYDPESRIKVIGSDLGWSREVWSHSPIPAYSAWASIRTSQARSRSLLVLTEVGRRLGPRADLARRACARRADQPNWAPISRNSCWTMSRPASTSWPSRPPGARPPQTDRRNLPLRAAQQGDSWTLSGRKNPVLAGDSADTLVVSAMLPDGGTGLFLVDAQWRSPGRRTRRSTDSGAPGSDLDSAPAQPLGDAVDALGTHP